MVCFRRFRWAPPLAALCRWVRQNKGVVTTVIMECGVVSCVRNTTRGDCTNNGGIGGVITGELSAECKRALPV